MSRLLGLGMLSVLLFTTFLSFYQVHHQVRQDFQQQLAMMNQLLVKATTLLLLDDGEQDINAFYSTAQHHARFPVLSITLLDADKEVVSSTGLSTLLQQPESDWFADQHQIHWLHHGRILSSQPLRLEQQIKGYLLLEAGSPPFPWSLWLWQLLIWLCLPCLLLLVLWLRANQLRTALEQNNQALEQAIMRWLAGEPALPLAQQHPMAHILFQLTERIERQQQQQEEQRAELARQLVQATQSKQALQAQQQLADQELQQLKLQQSYADQLTTQMLQTLVQTPAAWQSSLLQDLLQVRQDAPTAQVMPLAEWIGQQAEVWRTLVRPEQQLLLEEDSQVSDYQVQLAADALALCCRTLLRISGQQTHHCQLTLQWQLAVTEAKLQLRLLLKGESLPAELCQQLERVPQTQLQHPADDVQLFALSCQQLSASVAVSCLDELGTSVQLSIPCSYSSRTPANQIPKLHLLAAVGSLPASQLYSLKLACRQLVHCHSLAELKSAQPGQSEPVLLVLPEPNHPESAGYQTLLLQANCLALAASEQIAAWQPFASAAILPMPQSSAEIAVALQPFLVKAPQPLRLLVVDDNETNQAFIKAMLASFPLQLTAAMTGQQALGLCQGQQFDLILMDIQLPDISGMDVTRQLRQSVRYLQVPILAFTAHALPDEIALFKQAGMNDVVIKPLDARKLANLMSWCRPQPGPE